MWKYKRKTIKSIEDLPDCIGFVYKITNLESGKFYIGRKELFHSRKTRIGKKEKLSTKTRKTFKKVVKESDWLTYYGSNQELKEDVSKLGESKFKREILEVCCNKKYLGYCEVLYQIQHDVLNNNSYNGNISGKWYRRDMDNCKD